MLPARPSRSLTPRRRRAVLAIAFLALLTTACAAEDDAGDAGSSDATMQLGWIANIENMGPYVALDDGYFADEGVDMSVQPGGPAVSVEPLVVSGKALIGLTSVDIAARAVLEGAPLKIVAITLQNNPTAIMSLAEAPVRTLAELEGKSLCIQNSGVEVTKMVLRANDVDVDAIEFVPVDFDPSPLVTGECDAFQSFLNNQPVTLQAQGVETFSFLLSDYGYDIPANVFVVSDETLADEAARKRVVSAITATSHGWRTALDDPDAAAKLLVDDYGKDQQLDLAQQQLGARAMAELVVTEQTQKHGILSMTDDQIGQIMSTLDDLGIDIDRDELFDASLLEDAELTK